MLLSLPGTKPRTILGRQIARTEVRLKPEAMCSESICRFWVKEQDILFIGTVSNVTVPVLRNF